MDTQNDGLEKVVLFKYGNFWYLYLIFWGYPLKMDGWKMIYLL